MWNEGLIVVIVQSSGPKQPLASACKAAERQPAGGSAFARTFFIWQSLRAEALGLFCSAADAEKCRAFLRRHLSRVCAG